MTSKLTIDVTKEDIEGGTIGSCSDCPIAWAIRRVTGAYDVRVCKTVAHYQMTKDSGVVQLYLPLDAIGFIHSFDHSNDDDRGLFQPFRFVASVEPREFREKEA